MFNAQTNFRYVIENIDGNFLRKSNISNDIFFVSNIYDATLFEEKEIALTYKTKSDKVLCVEFSARRIFCKNF